MTLDALSLWSSDLMRVFRRFPLAILFCLAMTVVALMMINGFAALSDEDGVRLFAGMGTGFVLALAGRLFIESRPDWRWTGIVLAYVLPLVTPILFQLRDTGWMALPILPAAAVMWLSVSGFTHIGEGTKRVETEDRFWWFNQRAVISGGIAIAASVVLLIGLLAIDRSLDLLFGIEIWDLLGNWVLPVVFLLLAPLYWLAVLPALDAYDRDTQENPDFLTQAIGFLGQYILTPLLAVYTLILVAYTVQIAITRTLPVGVLGWLVLSFVVTGAANWLVLHPVFVRKNVLSRLFRRTWFWATLLPLALFALGLFERIDAYGLTPERMLLIGGGVWAVLLALFYLLPGGYGDIRLIPGLAGLVFLVLGFGPFNLLAAPVNDQAHRFETALAEAQTPSGATWTPELASKARSALDFLEADDRGKARLDEIIARHGYDADADSSATVIAESIGLPARTRNGSLTVFTLTRAPSSAVSVVATPYLLGEISLHGDEAQAQADIVPMLSGSRLSVSSPENADLQTEVDLADWLDGQISANTLADPTIDFALDTRQFRLIADKVTIKQPAPDAPFGMTGLSGLLFSDRP